MALTYFPGGEGQLLVIGISTDSKPTPPTDGWTFLEGDTGKFYLASGGFWKEKQNASYSQTTDSDESQNLLDQVVRVLVDRYDFPMEGKIMEMYERACNAS